MRFIFLALMAFTVPAIIPSRAVAGTSAGTSPRISFATCESLFAKAKRARKGLILAVLEMTKRDRPHAGSEIQRLEKLVANGLGDIPSLDDFRAMYTAEIVSLKAALVIPDDTLEHLIDTLLKNELPVRAFASNPAISTRLKRIQALADAIHLFQAPTPPVLLSGVR